MRLPVNQVILGDCGTVMVEWPGNSVDCVVTDPPYRIGFMGKSWDRALPPRRAFKQVFRVLKPGALAFVMTSPRQDVLWRMLAMLEEIGFELRQSHISWVYRTGFPKAYDISKGIDRKLGLEREIIGKQQNFGVMGERTYGEWVREWDETKPTSDLAKKWEGWKSQTGLKPALEMILMVNKPRSEKTIVDNVLKHGVGAINVDACRIPFQNEDDVKRTNVGYELGVMKYGGTSLQESKTLNEEYTASSKGRFPANLLVSDGALDTGETTKSRSGGIRKAGTEFGQGSGWNKHENRDTIRQEIFDEGSPYRFFDLDAWSKHNGFLDVAKPSKAERDFGLWGFEEKELYRAGHGNQEEDDVTQRFRRQARNIHATVKPVKLMAYLISLGCPPDGIVVDPFLGTGTTCIAAKKLRRKWIGIEINPEYAKIAERRINIRGPLDQYMKDEK